MQNLRPKDLLVIDIETVSAFPRYAEMDENWQMLWREKVEKFLPENISVEEFYEQRAGIMAEFSKIVCISIGYFLEKESLKLRIKSFYGSDEKLILKNFLEAMQKVDSLSRSWQFAGHNIKEFDIPFICRRMIINQIAIPPFLDFQNMKPWETNIVDSFHYWRFGDYKNFTSLKLLAATLSVPTSKSDIDGSKVGATYWIDNDIKRISDYCEQDVLAVANIFLRLNNLEILNQSDVEIVTD